MELPVIDIAPYLEIAGNGEDESTKRASVLSELCREVSRLLKETGALLVQDPRCTVEDNDRFIDMMEKYFEKPAEFKRLQGRPYLHYQVRFFIFSPKKLFFSSFECVFTWPLNKFYWNSDAC